jgi:hypothetical protein
MTDSVRIEHSLRTTLTQLQHVLLQLTAEEYKKALPILSNASIGQHTRHVIEFFQTLVNAYDEGKVNYDKRDRSQLLETDQRAAFNVLAMIQDYMVREDKDISLTGAFIADSNIEITVRSTYHRELIYNLEHAIHHMAMIKIGIRNSTNLAVPSDFGIASATLQYQKTIL